MGRAPGPPCASSSSVRVGAWLKQHQPADGAGFGQGNGIGDGGVAVSDGLVSFVAEELASWTRTSVRAHEGDRVGSGGAVHGMVGADR